MGDRDFHHQQKYCSQLQFFQQLQKGQLCLQSKNAEELGTPWHLRWSKGTYQNEGIWYWNYALPEETRRGLGDKEDLYSPGYLSVVLESGDTVTIEAQLGFCDKSNIALNCESFNREVLAEEKRLSEIFAWEGDRRIGGWENDLDQFITPNSSLLTDSPSTPSSTSLPPKDVIWKKLLRASDQFIVHRTSINGPTVIAGYHWFNDWGRDTLIALPGLAIVPQRFEIAKGLLRTFGHYCHQGLIPNAFPECWWASLFYSRIYATLWWIETLGLYLEGFKIGGIFSEGYRGAEHL